MEIAPPLSSIKSWMLIYRGAINLLIYIGYYWASHHSMRWLPIHPQSHIQTLCQADATFPSVPILFHRVACWQIAFPPTMIPPAKRLPSICDLSSQCVGNSQRAGWLVSLSALHDYFPGGLPMPVSVWESRTSGVKLYFNSARFAEIIHKSHGKTWERFCISTLLVYTTQSSIVIRSDMHLRTYLALSQLIVTAYSSWSTMSW